MLVVWLLRAVNPWHYTSGSLGYKGNPSPGKAGGVCPAGRWGGANRKISLESLYGSLCCSPMKKIGTLWSTRLYMWITDAARFTQPLFSAASVLKQASTVPFLCGNLVAGCGGEAVQWLILQGIPWWIGVFLLLDLCAVSFNAGACGW